jgi:microcin C transport system substrate-binding protein
VFYRQFNAAYVEQYQWKIPPTTGGYRLDASSVVRGRELTLKRVPTWWAARKKYYRYSCNVDRITHYFLTDPVLAMELFRRGDLDALYITKGEVWDDVGEFDEAIRGYVVRTAFAHQIPEPPYGISMNTASAPLDQLAVRQGLMHALDMEAICERLFHGKADRLHSYLEGLGTLTDDTLQPPNYDPNVARQYFEQAGFDRVGPDGILMDAAGRPLKVELTYPASTGSVIVAACRLFKEQAKACGVELVLDPLEGSVCARKINDRRYQMAFWATMFSAPVPDIYNSFHSSAARDAAGRVIRGSENIFCVADAEMDQYLDGVRAAQDLDTLRSNLYGVQRRIQDLALWIPGWKDPFARLAYWRWVQWPKSEWTNFSVPNAYNPLESHLYWVDTQEQKQVNEARHQGIEYPEVEETIYPGELIKLPKE